MITKDPKSADPEKDLNRLLNAIEKNKNRIQQVGYNNMKGSLVRRIFNNGESTDGGPIGQYAFTTKRSRQRRGFQISRVDLEISGTLRRSIIVGKFGDELVLGMKDQLEPGTSLTTTQNAIDQEQRFNKEIFAPSKAEVKEGEVAILKEVNIIAKKALKSSTG